MRFQTPPPGGPDFLSGDAAGKGSQFSTFFRMIRASLQWLPQYFGFGVLMVLVVAVLVTSESTYRNTTSVLQSGRANADSRVHSLRLLLLLTQIETAELAFLANRQPRYLQQFTDLQKTVPEVSQGIVNFFRLRGDAEGAVYAAQITDLTRGYLANANKVIQLAQQGEFAGASTLVANEENNLLLTTLSDTLMKQFTQASYVSRAGRVATDGALLKQRIAIAALTVLTALCAYLLLRQLKTRGRRRDARELDLVADRDYLDVEVRHRTARLSELAGHLQTVSESERAHLARELHDELGGLLTVCKLEIARARGKTGDPAEILKRLDSVTLHLNSGIALKRRIIEGLQPSALTHLGLVVALENLCRDMGSGLGIPMALSMAPFRLPPDAELSVYRFIQEALTNAGKYADPTAVEVSLEVVNGQVRVAVSDNGKGFDVNTPRTGHHGLAGMQFRAESLGGAMHLSSAPGEGTTVRMEFPEIPAQVPFTH